jgi:hypothetical protein
MLALAVLVSLIRAATASAFSIAPTPINPVTVAVPIAKTIASVPLKAATSALLSVLKAIFGGVEAKLLTDVIKGLLAIPNFNSGNVAALEQTTSALSIGMLGSVLTLSIFRYYLSGLSDSGSGGFEAIQGVTRVIGVAGFICAWPSVFGELVLIPKMFDSALLGSPAVQNSVATLFDGALAIGAEAFVLSSGLGLIFVVLIGLLGALVFIGLLWMKVLLSVMLMFLFVSMPLCVVMWPVPELSWLASAAMRSMFVALLVPCVWAIVFALAAAVNADVLSWAPSHSIIDTVVIRPLAGITLMLLCISLPRFLMRTVMIGPAGEGRGGARVWRAVTLGLFAARAVSGTARTVAAAANEGQKTAQRVIDHLPQQAKPPHAAGEGSLAGRMIYGRSGFGQGRDEPGVDPPLIDPEGDSPSQPGGGGEQSAGSGEDTQAEQPPATPTEQQSGGTEEQGEQPAGGPVEQPAAGAEGATEATGARAGADRAKQAAGGDPVQAELIDRAGVGMFHDAHAGGSSKEEVADAIGQLRPSAQARITSIAGGNPEKLRDSIAQTLHNPAWSEEERDALWTIGSARMKEVEEGIALAATRRHEAAAAETPAGGPEPAAGGDPGGSPAAQPAPDPGIGAATGAQAPAGGQAPPSPPRQEPAAGNGGDAPEKGGPAAQAAPGGRSLGSGLVEQPSPTGEPAEAEPPDIPDSEPFLP